MFARKIQLNWGFVPALSHVTTHTLHHPQPGTGSLSLIPSSPILLSLPVPPPLSSQHTHPVLSLYHPAEEQRREEGSRQEGREKDTVGNQCCVQALCMYIYKKWNHKFKGEDHKSLVTVWHSGKLWWAAGESRFPQHLYSQLRSRLKWKIEANGYTCTKAGGSWAVQHPWCCGSSGKGALSLDCAPQSVSQHNALGLPAKCSQSLFPSPLAQVSSVLTR